MCQLLPDDDRVSFDALEIFPVRDVFGNVGHLSFLLRPDAHDLHTGAGLGRGDHGLDDDPLGHPADVGKGVDPAGQRICPLHVVFELVRLAVERVMDLDVGQLGVDGRLDPLVHHPFHEGGGEDAGHDAQGDGGDHHQAAGLVPPDIAPGN